MLLFQILFDSNFAYNLVRASFNHGNCKNLGQILEGQENSFIL